MQFTTKTPFHYPKGKVGFLGSHFGGAVAERLRGWLAPIFRFALLAECVRREDEIKIEPTARVGRNGNFADGEYTYARHW